MHDRQALEIVYYASKPRTVDTDNDLLASDEWVATYLALVSVHCCQAFPIDLAVLCLD